MTPKEAKKNYRQITHAMNPESEKDQPVLWKLWHELKEKYGDGVIMVREPRGEISLWALKSMTLYDKKQDVKLPKGVTCDLNRGKNKKYRPVGREVTWHKTHVCTNSRFAN